MCIQPIILCVPPIILIYFGLNLACFCQSVLGPWSEKVSELPSI